MNDIISQNKTFSHDVWLYKARELYNIQQQRKALEKVESQLVDDLKKLQDNQPFSFGGMKFYYEQRTGNVDYSSIPELKNVNLDLYRKSLVKVWKISVENI